MATTAGIWNHPAVNAGSQSVNPMDTSSGGTGSSAASDSANISANDFLTLLVTEMQNQDPTANTDPNEYINQLVNVNSLEQLISINQTLTTATKVPTTPTGTQGTNGGTGGEKPAIYGGSSQLPEVAQNPGSLKPVSLAPNAGLQSAGSYALPVHLAPGNLSVPTTNLAAQRVAQSLSGR